MSKVILSFRFYFCLGFPAGRRTGSIALDRDEAKSTSSAGVFENLLNLFWWPFLPLFHCEKECLSVPGIRRFFWVVFFLLAVHLVTTYGRKPISQPQKNRISRHRYTKVRFSRKNPPFYLKHVLKLRPCTWTNDNTSNDGGAINVNLHCTSHTQQESKVYCWIRTHERVLTLLVRERKLCFVLPSKSITFPTGTVTQFLF